MADFLKSREELVKALEKESADRGVLTALPNATPVAIPGIGTVDVVKGNGGQISQIGALPGGWTRTQPTNGQFNFRFANTRGSTVILPFCGKYTNALDLVNTLNQLCAELGLPAGSQLLANQQQETINFMLSKWAYTFTMINVSITSLTVPGLDVLAQRSAAWSWLRGDETQNTKVYPLTTNKSPQDQDRNRNVISGVIPLGADVCTVFEVGNNEQITLDISY